MICFAWNGFPQYAARCIAAFVKTTSERVVVIGTAPDIPIVGMEEVVGCQVIWVKETDYRTIMDVCGEVPRVLMVSGWATPCFNRWRDEVRRAGCRVIVSVDNNYELTFKQVLKAVRFRLLLKNKYDGFFVPGVSGECLLRLYGVRKDDIYRGLYAADSSIFYDGQTLTYRPKRILFVGRFNQRKNIVPFCEEFLKIPESVRKGWELEICGCGILKNQIPDHTAIRVHDFVQPVELSGIYRDARFFALPSKEEHWGLVVHEAALSGCGLLLSNRVGAAKDFVDEENGVLFDPYNRDEIRESIVKCLTKTDRELDVVHRRSLQLSQNASIALFVSEFLRFLNKKAIQ